MSLDEAGETVTYNVVVNQEGQYSIWPDNRSDAPGWRQVGKAGAKEECLAYIKEVWTDMRPLSLRQVMDAAASEDEKPDSVELTDAMHAKGDQR
jgi:MbtH protein